MKKLAMLFILFGILSEKTQCQTIFEENGKFGLKSSEGEVLQRAEFDILIGYEGYTYAVYDYEYDYAYTPTKLIFVANKGGKIVTTTVKDTIYGYDDDYLNYSVKEVRDREVKLIKGGSFYLISPQGQLINADPFENIALDFAEPVKYDYGEPYVYQFAAVDDESNLTTSDRNVIRTISGVMVKKNGKWGLMSMEPKYVVPCVSDKLIMVNLLDGGNNIYRVFNGKKTKIYDHTGKSISDEYDYIGIFNTWENYSDYSKSVATVKNGNKLGVLQLNGNVIIQPKYDYLIHVKNNIYIFNKGGKTKHYEWNDSSAFYNYQYGYGYDLPEDYVPQVYVVKDSLIEGGKFGVIINGKEIISASYSFIEYDYKSNYFFGHTGGKEPKNPKSTFNYGYGYGYEYDYAYEEYGYNNYNYGSGEYEHYLRVEMPEGSKKSIIDSLGKVKMKDIETVNLNYINSISREVDANGLYVNKNHFYHMVTNKEKSSLVDDNFKTILPMKFSGFTYNPFIENNTIIAFDDKYNYQLYSLTTGKPVTSQTYAIIYNGEKFYYYNKGGNWIEKEESYYDYYLDSNFTYKVTKLIGGKYGIIKSNNEDMGAIYDSIFTIGSIYNYDYYSYDDYGSKNMSKPILGYKKNGLMGTFKSNGDVGINAKYSQITYDYTTKMLKITMNGLQGMANMQGRVIIEPKYTNIYSLGYSYYGGGVAKYVATDENNLQGIIDTNGNVLFDFKYNWIDSYKFNQGKDIIKVSKNSLYGYADKEGNEVLPCEYQDINDYFNTYTNVALVTKDGKTGFYNLNTLKMTTAPKYSEVALYDEKIKGLTKVIMGGEKYYDSISYLNKVRGGKIGYVDSLGNEIIPPKFTSVIYNNEIDIFLCVDGNNRSFYTRRGDKINDGETKWRNTFLGKKMLENAKIASLSWGTPSGPVGADATSFYYDEKGVYWLGTGSSGGVYRSFDKGQTWKETNKGIGPKHIIFINQLYDTLFIVDQGAGSYSNYEMYNGEFGYFDAVHYWDTKTESWIKISEERKYEIANELYSMATAQYTSGDNYKPYSNYNYGSSYFPNYLQDYYYFNMPYNTIGKYNPNTYGYDDFGNNGMPHDCYANPAGNLFQVEDDNFVLLAKSGIFKCKVGEEMNQLPENGLIASDITQIGYTPSGAVIMREGTSDIWKFENKTWTKLLDAYQLNKELGESKFGYYTGNFTIDKNGNIYVPFRGDILMFDQSGKSKTILKGGEMKDYYNEDEFGYNGYSRIEFIQAGRTADNKLFALVNCGGYYGNNFGFLEFDDNYKIINYKDSLFETSYGVTYMINDDLGNLWGYRSNKIFKIGAEEKTMTEISWWEFNPNQIASGKNGELAVVKSYSSIAVFVPEKSKWVDLTLAGASTISALEFDDKGNLMYSSNYDFEYFCGEEQKIKKSDPNIGYIEFSMEGIKMKALNNPVNPRILSLKQHPLMGLLVGTSGSGIQYVNKK